MRVLITGAAGFVGKNMLRGFPSTWAITAVTRDGKSLRDFCARHSLSHVAVVEVDLRNAQAVSAAFKSAVFDVCVHLAANGDPRLAAEKPSVDVMGNVVPLLTLLESGVRIERFIHFSSGSVYEGHTGLVGPQTPLRTYTPYSISKQAAESYVQFFRARGVIGSYVIIRFFGCYGPYEAERKIYRRLVNASRLGSQDSLTFYGDGSNLIYAMYASDAVQAISAVVTSQTSNVTVDLCGPETMTIREVVEHAVRELELKPTISFTGEVPIESHRFYVSNALFAELFGFTPSIKLSEGLKKYRASLSIE